MKAACLLTLLAMASAGILFAAGALLAQQPAEQPAPQDTPQGAAATPEEIDGYIAQLGDPDYAKRLDAYNRLLQIGRPALEKLQEALKNPDAEIRDSAQRLVDEINNPNSRTSSNPAPLKPQVAPVIFVELLKTTDYVLEEAAGNTKVKYEFVESDMGLDVTVTKTDANGASTTEESGYKDADELKAKNEEMHKKYLAAAEHAPAKVEPLKEIQNDIPLKFYLDGSTELKLTLIEALDDPATRDEIFGYFEDETCKLLARWDGIEQRLCNRSIKDALDMNAWVLRPECMMPGVRVKPVDPVFKAQLNIPGGLLVTWLGENAPQGLEANDIIVEIGGAKTRTADELNAAYLNVRDEKSYEAKIIRRGKEATVTIKPAAAPAQPPPEAPPQPAGIPCASDATADQPPDQGTEKPPAKDALDAKIDEYIAQLGDADFNKRKDAYDKLREIGHPALKQLREALKSDDPEILRSAQKLVDEISPPPAQQEQPAQDGAQGPDPNAALKRMKQFIEMVRARGYVLAEVRGETTNKYDFIQTETGISAVVIKIDSKGVATVERMPHFDNADDLKQSDAELYAKYVKAKDHAVEPDPKVMPPRKSAVFAVFDRTLEAKGVMIEADKDAGLRGLLMKNYEEEVCRFLKKLNAAEEKLRGRSLKNALDMDGWSLRPACEAPGLEVMPVDEAMKAQFNIKGGLVVLERAEGSPLAGALKESDIITEINGTIVNSIDELNKAWLNCRDREKYEVKVLRGGKEETLTVVPPKAEAPAPAPIPAP